MIVGIISLARVKLGSLVEVISGLLRCRRSGIRIPRAVVDTCRLAAKGIFSVVRMPFSTLVHITTSTIGPVLLVALAEVEVQLYDWLSAPVKADSRKKKYN